MSTLMYAAVTTKRLQAPSGESTTTAKPGLSTYVDAMAALVPAEVLAAHAVIISFATSSTGNAGHEITKIDNRGALQVSFYALMAISAGLFLGTRIFSAKSMQPEDYLRALVPPAAFVLWTMLQKATAFDAIAPSFTSSSRSIYAILLAIVVGGLAKALGVSADKKAA